MTSLRLFSLTFSALTFLACGEPADPSTSGPDDNNTQSSSTTQDPDPGTASEASESDPAGSTTTTADPDATTGLDTGTTTFPDPPDDTTDSGDTMVDTTGTDPGCGGLICEADETCNYVDDQPVCTAKCHPLLADQCGPGEKCALLISNSIGCVPDTSEGPGGEVGDPCPDGVVSCDPGNVCMGDNFFADCDSELCCSTFCDVTQPDACSAYGMECTLWWTVNPPPPGHENLGVCVLPGTGGGETGE